MHYSHTNGKIFKGHLPDLSAILERMCAQHLEEMTPARILANLGRILATRPLAERSLGCSIDLRPRLAEKPSDHTIILAEFDL